MIDWQGQEIKSEVRKFKRTVVVSRPSMWEDVVLTRHYDTREGYDAGHWMITGQIEITVTDGRVTNVEILA